VSLPVLSLVLGIAVALGTAIAAGMWRLGSAAVALSTSLAQMRATLDGLPPRVAALEVTVHAMAVADSAHIATCDARHAHGRDDD
jgi:hypothetical protein